MLSPDADCPPPIVARIASAGSRNQSRRKRAKATSIIRDLDQVQIRVANIDRLYRADRTSTWPRSRHDGNPARLEMRGYFGERHRSNETQVARTRSRLVGDQARDIAGRMQVDLLLAKAQRGAAFAKAHDLHSEHLRVKFAGAVDIRDGQNQMIEPFDVHYDGPHRQGTEPRLPRSTPCGQPRSRSGRSSRRLSAADLGTRIGRHAQKERDRQ